MTATPEPPLHIEGGEYCQRRGPPCMRHICDWPQLGWILEDVRCSSWGNRPLPPWPLPVCDSIRHQPPQTSTPSWGGGQGRAQQARGSICPVTTIRHRRSLPPPQVCPSAAHTATSAAPPPAPRAAAPAPKLRRLDTSSGATASCQREHSPCEVSQHEKTSPPPPLAKQALPAGFL